MSELILTDEEKAVKFWNDLDDASLGRVVKYFGYNLFESVKLDKKVTTDIDLQHLLFKTAVLGMCSFLKKKNISAFKGKITDLINEDGSPAGNWEITFMEIKNESN